MKQFDNTYAVIMAGGEGRRLWPLSTPRHPKQFISVFGGKPLIRHAADRLQGIVPPERILVVTAKHFIAKTRKALPHIPPVNIIGEPCARDTAGAVAIACALVKKLGGDNAVGCIFPADHLIAPKKSFGNDLKRAIKAAEKSDAIVTIGISPDRPATEYGYIECAGRLGPTDKALALRASRFVEKPDAKTADRYLKSGRYLWNAGIFIWRTKTLESAFASAAPDIGNIIHPLASAKNVQTALARHYPGVRKISFDYAVMEKTREILVVRSTFKWDDVGSLQSLARHFAADANGNIVIGEPVLHETKSSIAIARGPGKLVMAGLKNIIAVHTKDAILIMAKDAACDMKKITSPQP